MKKTDDANKAPPASFNPKAGIAKSLAEYIDVAKIIARGSIAEVKFASMANVNFDKPITTTGGNSKDSYETLPVILAIEAGRTETFDFLLTNSRTRLNVESNYLRGPKGMVYPAAGTPLDAAYNLKEKNSPHGQYFYDQLIANGAKLAIGEFKDDIAEDVAKYAKTKACSKTAAKARTSHKAPK